MLVKQPSDCVIYRVIVPTDSGAGDTSPFRKEKSPFGNMVRYFSRLIVFCQDVTGVDQQSRVKGLIPKWSCEQLPNLQSGDVGVRELSLMFV